MKKGIMHALVMVVISVVLASSDAGAFFGLFEDKERIRLENGVVTIPISDVSDGTAKYYTAESGGKSVRFFVIQSRDGVLRTAFDACDVCFREKKGYSQNGEFMICNSCGQKFHVSRINVVRGGCNPAPLERTYDEKAITITAESLQQGERFF